MSARRELSALWSHCGSLRERIGLSGGALSLDARRLLEDASDELTSAVRRLVSAGMLTPAQLRELEDAHAGLVAACGGGLSAATAVARYGLALQGVAAALRISLGAAPAEPVAAVAPRRGDGTADAEPPPAAGSSEVVATLAFVTTVAAKGGHRLGGFSGSGSGAGYRLTARCAGCGDQVSVHRHAGAWSFSPVVRCSHTAPVPTSP